LAAAASSALGKPKPSPPLGIVVHDHIIVGKNGHVSLKGMKVI
jgi:DNA repair protein RadC